jgi:hypothetical protein
MVGLIEGVRKRTLPEYQRTRGRARQGTLVDGRTKSLSSARACHALPECFGSVYHVKNGGKLTILLILIVGAALGSFGWLWQLSKGRRALEAWGSENAMVIRYGSRAELSTLSGDAPAEGEARKLQFDERTVYASPPRDISGAGDLVHYRWALVDDHAFDWESRHSADSGDANEWSYALAFGDGATTRTLAFDFSRNIVRLVETGRELRLEPLTAERLAGFLKEQAGEE